MSVYAPNQEVTLRVAVECEGWLVMHASGESAIVTGYRFDHTPQGEWLMYEVKFENGDCGWLRAAFLDGERLDHEDFSHYKGEDDATELLPDDAQQPAENAIKDLVLRLVLQPQLQAPDHRHEPAHDQNLQDVSLRSAGESVDGEAEALAVSKEGYDGG